MEETNVTQAPELSEQELSELLQIRRDKLTALQNAGKDPFAVITYPQTHHSTDITGDCDPETHTYKTFTGEETVSVAGRLMSKRVMGKASFCHIQDLKGEVQAYVARDNVGEEPYAEFKKLDIGDIVGIEGTPFVTKMGEPSIHATTKDTLIKRSRIISSIRNYLNAQGFLEVETPMLVSNAGGAAARPFETHFNALDEDFKLRISLELYLKRLIVGGLEKVYEIGRVFRNEGIDTRHNPEFTLMELYQAYTDYHGMMDLTENLFRHLAHDVIGSGVISYNGIEMDLEKPFARITMLDAVKQYAGVDFREVKTLQQARELAKAHNIAYEERHKKGDILNLFFDEYVEDKLIQPTFVMDHPVEISPLTKRKPDDPDYVERFEFYMNGWEMCNAYSELNDPIDQRARFAEQDALDFLNALEIGMPPTGGIGYGIDRLCMLFTNSSAIRDVLLFPTMKSVKTGSEEKEGQSETSEKPVEAAPAIEGAPIISAEKPDFSNVQIEPLFSDYVDFETFSKSDFRAVKVLECEAVPKSKKLLKFTRDDGTGTERTILSGIHAFYEPEQLIGKTLIAIVNLPPRAMMGIESCGMLLSAVHKENDEEKLHLLQVDPHIPAGAKLY